MLTEEGGSRGGGRQQGGTIGAEEGEYVELAGDLRWREISR